MTASTSIQSQDDDALFKLVQCRIQDLTREGEAGWNKNKTALDDIDAELQRRYPAGGGFDVQSARAEIAMALRRYKAAIELWATAPRTVDDQHSLADFQIAVCYRRMGNVFEARGALHAVKGYMTTKLRYQNEVRRVAEATDRFAAIHLSTAAFQKLEAAGLQEAKALMQATAVIRQQSPTELGLLEQTLDCLVQFAADSPLPPARREADEGSRPVLLICGFEWSGSGALADCIRTSGAVYLPFGDTEVSLFEGVPDVADGVAQLLKLAKGGSREAFRQCIVKFVAGPVLGLAFPPADNAKEQQLYRKSLAAFIRPNAAEAHTAIRGLLADVDEASRDGVDWMLFRQALRRFMRWIVGENDGRRAVLNNCIHAYNLECLDLFDDARAVCVVRDPRDQYVARVRENWIRRIKLNRFMILTARHMKRYRKGIEALPSRGAVMTVRFEDFVCSERVRKATLEFCGVPPSELGLFDPAKSKLNIGIFQGFENQADIREIESGFPELLYSDHASAPT